MLDAEQLGKLFARKSHVKFVRASNHVRRTAFAQVSAIRRRRFLGQQLNHMHIGPAGAAERPEGQAISPAESSDT
mgnify:CR=1 FL=1